MGHQGCVVLVVFLDSRLALMTLIKWSNRGVRFETPPADRAISWSFAVALCIPRARKEVVTSLDGFLGEKMTRRTAIATVAGTAALVATEFALSKTAPAVEGSAGSAAAQVQLLADHVRRLERGRHVALRVPAADHAEHRRFCPQGHGLHQFLFRFDLYDSMRGDDVDGIYPSQNTGLSTARPGCADKMPRRACRTRCGRPAIATGAFFSNPYAYYLAKERGERVTTSCRSQSSSRVGYSICGMRPAPLHQDSGIGSRIDEYFDLESMWNLSGRLPRNLHERFRAAASFEHAREMLAKLPDGFFLWVHVMTPHGPYLPDAADRGRFLPANEQRIFEGEG